MLEYETTGRVKTSAVRAIRADVAAIQRDWWRGKLGIDVSDEEHPAILSGRTPLFYNKTVIPDSEDLFVAFSDAAFILEKLSGWSKKYKIKWHLRMQGEDWGAVDPSGLTKPLLDQMGKWAHRLKIFPNGRDTWFVPEDRRVELLARHAGRRGP